MGNEKLFGLLSKLRKKNMLLEMKSFCGLNMTESTRK
jgi:hypothetical protein